jgi:hypothetical protein
MPVDIPDPNNVVAASTGAIVGIPTSSITAVTSNIDGAQKKVAELGLKSKKTVEDDPTDDDVSNMFELVKLAIVNGATVTDIDLKAFIPHFQEEVKLKTKKYTNAKIVSFFTGGTFTFLMYLFIEYLKTVT